MLEIRLFQQLKFRRSIRIDSQTLVDFVGASVASISEGEDEQ